MIVRKKGTVSQQDPQEKQIDHLYREKKFLELRKTRSLSGL